MKYILSSLLFIFTSTSQQPAQEIIEENTIEIISLSHLSHEKCHKCDNIALFYVRQNDSITYCCSKHASVEHTQSVSLVFDGNEWGIFRE